MHILAADHSLYDYTDAGPGFNVNLLQNAGTGLFKSEHPEPVSLSPMLIVCPVADGHPKALKAGESVKVHIARENCGLSSEEFLKRYLR